ncbi:hypothetical protein [Enterococcus wangshanyuanii]|uniref:Uncharacterized protein n=1 Tax=Enterococcus wangshanyuanii TaxID=2005703 RepID=A0ABQ1PAZ1_9ENTE|nr:hypothetical protein [Enterococcus wangshanyuanii]GGC93507.1 hypothetical protein GCM10011573_23930 [Enterococcus wangshanyuanii]
MFNKRKIKKWFKYGEMAIETKDYKQAVYFFKLVIEGSMKHGGIRFNDCFNALVHLGDIYNEEHCFDEAEQLYRMAAGMDSSAKYVLLKDEFFHTEFGYELDRKKWLKRNMIDYTDIIQAKKKNHWGFLIDETKTEKKYGSAVKKIKKQSKTDPSEEFVWAYGDSLDTSPF